MLSLIVLQGPGKGRVFRLNGDFPVLIGRQTGDLRLMDTQVSRRHAQIAFENGAWILRDLGSTNGTFVNGELVSGMVELEESDQIQIGSFVLLVGPLSLGPKALDDTKMVDAESMDHVLLSPVMPPEVEISDLQEVSQEDESAADVMHVEPIAHEDRPEQPEDAESEAAISQLSDAASESSIFDQIATELPPPPEIPPPPEAHQEVSREEDAPAEIEAASEAEALADIESPEEAEPPAEVELKAESFAEADVVEELPPVEAVQEQAEVESLSEPELEPEPEQEQESEPVSEPQSASPQLPELQEVPANILDTVMDSPLQSYDDENQVEAGRIVGAASDQDHPAWQDDQPKLPRYVAQSAKYRLLWPLSVAIVLLALVGGGAGYWLIAGRSSPLSTRAAQQTNPEPLAAVPNSPFSTAPPTTSQASSPAKPAAPVAQKPEVKPSPSPVAEAPKPPTATVSQAMAPAAMHPGAAMLTSVLEDGPQLMGDSVLRQRVRDNSSVPSVPAAVPQAEQPSNPAVSPSATATATAPPQPSTPAEQSVADQTESPQPAASSQPQEPQAASAATPALQLDQQNVAYLIDASGSLVDTLPELLNWLDEHLQQIDPELHYTVIFFRGGEALEAPPAGLKDGTDRTLRRQVRQWIGWDSGNIIPYGRSDPRSAMDLALSYHVGRIFLLSDGHVGDRLSDEQVADYLVRLEQQVGKEKLVIHNVQFFYPEVEGLLAHLVRRYPGERTFIEPPRETEDQQPSPLDQ